jgi:hypothetical protein
MLALSKSALGQSAGPDTQLAASVARAQQQYAASFVGHPQLFSGPEYLDYSRRYHDRVGTQFYPTQNQQPGTIVYNDHYFADFSLVYDAVLDQVVLSPPDSPLMLRLVNENVRNFSIGDHRFIRLVADSLTGTTIRTGFYEVLADGNVQVLARRSKRIQEHLNQRNIDVEFTTTDKLFIKKGGLYYPANRKGAALRPFADHNKEMLAYIKAQKLSFKRSQFEPSVVKLAEYYSSLATR